MQDGGRQTLNTPKPPAGPGGNRFLCRLDDIADPGSKGFENINGEAPFFIVRRGEAVVGYRNNCPHYGAPLDWKPDAFLSYDKDMILCSMHGALFGIEDGICTEGPCPGQGLDKVDICVIDGSVFVI